MAQFKAEVVTNINKNKLRSVLEDKGITARKLSADMGYDDSYISGFMRKPDDAGMPKTAYKLMCMLLGISEDVLIASSTSKCEGVENKTVEFDTTELVKALGQITQAICAQTVMIAKVCDELKRFNEPMENKAQVVPNKVVSVKPEVVPPAYRK